MMTSEPAVLTQTHHHLPTEHVRPDSNNDADPTIPAGVYPKPQRLTRCPSKYASPFKGTNVQGSSSEKQVLPYSQQFKELSFKFMSYLVQCLRHDESD